MTNTSDQPQTNTLDQTQAATPTAVDRADALLSTWGQRLNPTGKTPQGGSEAPRPHADGGTARRADTFLGRVGHRLSGRGLVEAAAYGYVALAVRVGKTAGEVQKTWQESAEAARRQQEQQAAKTGGKDAAHKVVADEKKGEQILSRTATDAAEGAEEGADVATEVAS